MRRRLHPLGFDQFQHAEFLLRDIRQRDCQADTLGQYPGGRSAEETIGQEKGVG